MKTHFGAASRAGIGLVALVATSLAGAAAFACDTVYAYRYQMQGGAYLATLNGVHLAHNAEPGDYFGGGPFMLWLKEGENRLTFRMDKGSAEVSVIEGCQGEFDGDTLVEASLAAPEMRELAFFVEGAPTPVYDDAAAKRKGLPKAVKRLQKAVREKNFKLFWKLHQGLMMEAENRGFPVEQMRAGYRQTLEEGTAEFSEDLVFTPVMDGRVWQVMTADYREPVRMTLKEDGGARHINTGVFWAKVDGKWRVVGM